MPEPERVDGLSAKQLELLRTIGETSTVRAAAEQLHMSRSNVYAGLRRITRKLQLGSMNDVIALARDGQFSRPD
jgi:DNA-binding CsgD family transcriptional regulator